MTNPTAAMLVIGDEILSGRTRDSNMHYLAGELTRIGGSCLKDQVFATARKVDDLAEQNAAEHVDLANQIIADEGATDDWNLLRDEAEQVALDLVGGPEQRPEPAVGPRRVDEHGRRRGELPQRPADREDHVAVPALERREDPVVVLDDHDRLVRLPQRCQELVHGHAALDREARRSPWEPSSRSPSPSVR